MEERHEVCALFMTPKCPHRMNIEMKKVLANKAPKSPYEDLPDYDAIELICLSCDAFSK